MLQYKTRGNVPPYEKRSVYFTCHPKDHERFFEKISDEILNIVDCAIWYSTDETYEDVETDLGSLNVNLFVIPITNKLLKNPDCRTMKVDVPFAQKNRIQILPLMQEPDLDGLFNTYFEDMHYLDPNAQDGNAMSYEEKLRRHLHSVLVGDELAEKIRAAFDAYIFLSYRKKDWKYANELMRLIHKDELCRDIAIWYDQYIVPGTKFPEAIMTALKKSDLFAMVVTPNLVNEINYVKTDEYPAAITNEKPIPILPAEMEKTDHELLSEWYPDIPDGVDARDETALSEALESTLLNKARKEQDDDPQHNFFIGLAYLDGIDMEVDHERALALITSAAEAKIPEAIEMLVSMFREGHGVKRDYHIAAEWQKKCVDYWEDRYQKTPDKRNYRKLTTSLYEFALQSFDLMDIAKTKQVHKRLMGLFNENSDTDYNFMLSVYKDYAICCIGDCDKNEIELCFHQFLSLKDRLTDTDTIYWSFEFYELLGNFYLKTNDMSRAEDCLQTALSLSEQLEGFYDRKLNLFNILCYLYNRKDDMAKVEYYFEEALTLIAQHSINNYNPKFLSSMQTTLNTLSLHLMLNKDSNRAEEMLQKSLDIGKMLYDKYESLKYSHILANTYAQIGLINISKGNFETAESSLQKALEYFHCLMDEAWTTDIQESVTSCYENLGRLYFKRDELNESENYYRNAVILREQWLEKNTNTVYLFALAGDYGQLGKIKERNGDINRAESWYRKSITVYEQLEKSCKIDDLILLSGYYSLLSNIILRKNDNINEAEIFLRKSIFLNERILKDSENAEISFLLAISYLHLGTLRFPYNRALLEKSLQIFSSIVTKYPNADHFIDIIKSTLARLD